ncbi:carbohydrate ABC transporter permease [Jeotgalibaca sp. MA1X17-3]|uniref:carbohydrate ABC transporter permease n=1 Tax=Jeotgalibaca sp. MA1X17-3 TaxID=2908211 RepID=UPI001F21F178|nr:carbohydrate ABC transporter permease [Jeotgalibaca sp. MA1X17-3]UJF15806.1 carbohydrate ABC transporter permease [Jeotgalibaca sp. MA1X17-3]
MKKNKSKFAKQLELVPGYLVLIAWVGFTAVILFWVIAASLSTTGQIFSGTIFQFETGLHWENYAKAWTAGNVSVFFKNSLIYAITSCILLIVICAPYAYALQRFDFKGKDTIKRLLSAASGVPVIMIIIPLYMYVARMGLLQYEWSNRIVLITLFVATKIPYTTIFLMAYYENISRTYEEAAAIDGCPPVKTFWQIIFPLVQGGIATVTIFNFIGIWNEYFLSLLFVNSDALRPVALGLFSLINGMQYSGDWAGLFASVIIVFMPTFIIYVFLSKKIIGGLVGGVKG